jgi:hypothetical protein
MKEKMDYYVYFHCIMNCRTIFWWNSPYGRKVFEIQKNRIRKTTGGRSGDSCTDLFHSLVFSP